MTGRATRSYVDEVAAGMLDFALVLESKLSEVTKTLLAKLRCDETGDDTFEEVDDCEVWGHAAIDWRPPARDDDGACEVLMWRRGDELVALATKDRRWQVTVDEGEVAIHAFGSDAAVLRLQPDGTCVLEASEIRLGGSGASDLVALAPLVKARLDSIQSTFDGHIHTTTATVGTGSVGVISPPTSPIGSLAAVAADKVYAE